MSKKPMEKLKWKKEVYGMWEKCLGRNIEAL